MRRWMTIGLWAGLGLAATTGDATAQIGVLLGADAEPGEPEAKSSVPWVDAPPEVRAAAVADFVVLTQNPLNAGLVMLAAGRGDGDDHLGRQEPTWNIPGPATGGQTTPDQSTPGPQGQPGGRQPGGGGAGGGGGSPSPGQNPGDVWVMGLMPPEGAGPLPAITAQPGGSPQIGDPPFALDLEDPPLQPTPPDGQPPEPGPPQVGEPIDPTDPTDLPQTPEPGTLILAGVGAAVIGLRRLRTKFATA